jgi:hypothetical protein
VVQRAVGRGVVGYARIVARDEIVVATEAFVLYPEWKKAQITIEKFNTNSDYLALHWA